MGSKTRLSSYCTKRGNNTVNLVTSRKTIARLARPIRQHNNQSAIFLPAFGRSFLFFRMLIHIATQSWAFKLEHWENIRVLPSQSTTALEHKLEDPGYDDVCLKNKGYCWLLCYRIAPGFVLHWHPSCRVYCGGGTKGSGYTKLRFASFLCLSLAANW